MALVDRVAAVVLPASGRLSARQRAPREQGRRVLFVWLVSVSVGGAAVAIGATRPCAEQPAGRTAVAPLARPGEPEPLRPAPLAVAPATAQGQAALPTVVAPKRGEVVLVSDPEAAPKAGATR